MRMCSPADCTVYYKKKSKDFNVMGLCGIEHVGSLLRLATGDRRAPGDYVR